MNVKQKTTVAVADIMIIIELCVSIYLAGRDPENMTMLFMKYFFLMFIPTLILAGFTVRKLRSKEPEVKA